MATPLAPALPRLGQRERIKNRQLAACRFRLLVRIPWSPSPSRAKLQSRAHLFSLTPAIRRNSPASRWTRPSSLSRSTRLYFLRLTQRSLFAFWRFCFDCTT